jgi:ketosteroid isomerase-like protein
MVKHILVAVAVICVVEGTSVNAQPRALVSDTPVESTLGSKERHEYIVTSAGNQAFDVTAQQRGLDVVLTVLSPTGEQLMQVDAASDDQGRGGAEVAHVRALAAGPYRIQVALFERPDQKAGTYSIAVTGVRAMTAAEVDNATSERTILAMEERWEKAGDTTDIPTRDAMLRKDGFALGPYAAVSRGRQQIIASWERQAKERARLGETRTRTLSEHSIRVAGDTAVSTARFLITSKDNENQPTSFSGQFVHVWARDNDGWKLVADYIFPFGRVPREPGAPLVIPTDVLAAYVGRYRVEHEPTVIEITTGKGGLTGRWLRPGQEPFTSQLTPINDTTFAGQGQDEVIFVRSAAGAVRELVLLRDGPAVKATREQ